MVGRHEKGAWDSVGCRAKHHESAMGCHGEKGRSDGYSCLCTTVSIRHGMGRGIEGNTKAVEQLASTASYSHGMDGYQLGPKCVAVGGLGPNGLTVRRHGN